MNLTEIKPDYDKVLTLLSQNLSNSEVWKDRYAGSIGQTLIGMLAGLTAYQQQEIERNVLELFPDTAVKDRSIYTIARMLGIRLTRKVGASFAVEVTRTNNAAPAVIPAYTTWGTSGGQSLVNVDPIFFPAGTSILTVVLWQGIVRTQDYFATGIPFERIIVSGTTPFSVSDLHVQVSVDKQLWTTVYQGLWNYTGNDPIVVDNTLGNGDLELQFGNNRYGRQLIAGQIVTVRYLDTQGTAGATIAETTTLNVPLVGYSARVLRYEGQGGDENPSLFYRVMGSHLFTSGGQAVTTEEYRAIGMQYPGIIDLAVIPQREINPYDLRLMNVIHMSPLLAAGGTWAREVDAPEPPVFIQQDNGVLPPNVYTYGVTCVNEVGETTMCPPVSFTLTAVGAILLKWNPVRGATKYKVYGRTLGTEQYMGTTNDTFFIDNGTISPVGSPPTTNGTQASWWTFSQWFENKKSSTVRLVYAAARRIDVRVVIAVYTYRDVSNLESIRQAVYANIVELFKPKFGSLGRKITKSDILCAASVPHDVRNGSAIDYAILHEPTTDLDPNDRVAYYYLAQLQVDAVYSTRTEVTFRG